jgi:hypothetical protein
MRDLKTLEKQLAEVKEELHELYKMCREKKSNAPYVATINKQLRRAHNLYININQEKQRRR